jgi:electron transfer flavoprotein alpha subunit
MILAVTWDSDDLGRAGQELLGAATSLGAALGHDVAFVTLGADAAAAAAAAGGFGAARAFVFDGDCAATGSEDAVAALSELARELQARVIVLPADERGGEVAPRLAERLAGTAVTHAVAVEVADGGPAWTRPVFGGKALATITAVAEPVVATLRRGSFEPAAATGPPAPVEIRSLPAGDGAVELVETEVVVEEAPLEEATVIVSGGAGLGGPEGFSELEELARLLGGAVGASLAAVDAGWAPPERQVGLTGKSVSPDVYFAFGISGASQHLAGIGGARAVVAVNTDSEAPIFRAARLGVVMDCRELLAALVAELRR